MPIIILNVKFKDTDQNSKLPGDKLALKEKSSYMQALFSFKKIKTTPESKDLIKVGIDGSERCVKTGSSISVQNIKLEKSLHQMISNFVFDVLCFMFTCNDNDDDEEEEEENSSISRRILKTSFRYFADKFEKFILSKYPLLSVITETCKSYFREHKNFRKNQAENDECTLFIVQECLKTILDHEFILNYKNQNPELNENSENNIMKKIVVQNQLFDILKCDLDDFKKRKTSEEIAQMRYLASEIIQKCSNDHIKELKKNIIPKEKSIQQNLNYNSEKEEDFDLK